MNSFTFAIFFLHYVSSGYVSQWASGQSEIQALTMSPSGKVLYTSGADGSIKVWSHPDGRLIETVPLKSHNIGIISILEATDSYLYAVGQGSNNIIVLTLTNITRVSQMIGSGGMISNVRLYNKDLFSSSGDGTIIQWSLSDKGILNKYTLPQNYGVIMSISFSTNFIFAILDSDVIIRFTIGQPNAMISSPVLGATSGRLQPLLVSNEQYVFYSLSDWSLVQVSTKDLSVIRSFTPHWGPLSALAISENLLFTSSQNDFIVKQWLIADDMSYGGPLSPNDDLFWSVRLFLVHDNYLYFCSERIDLIQQCIFSDKPSEYTEKPSSTIRPVGTLTSFGQTLSPTNLESEIEWTSLTEHIPADKRIFLKENSYMGSFLSHTEKGFAFGFWAGSGSVPRSQCSVPSFTYISMPSFEEKTWNISGYHYDSFVVQEKFFPRILSKYASVIVTDNNNNNWYVIHGGGFCNETVLRASLESPYRMFATNIGKNIF
jgi:WD40 repeat protein